MEFDLNLCLSKRVCNGLRGLACTALVIGAATGGMAAPARGASPVPVAAGDQSSKDIRIAGSVMDANKEPLTGAVVKVVGKPEIATATDIEGNFYLNVPQGSEIEVTFVGFKPVKEKVGTKAAYEFTLYEAPTDLDEVVVTAYGGGQKKASVIGAIETVKPALLQVGSNRSMANNLAGNIAGVIGVRRSGEPGYDNSTFWIRGISTFSGSVNPLVLIDGVERDLNNIDPAEIESFSVLKDASASAMYGVRGANGVIVINTKRGKVGKPTVDVRFEQSISKPTKLPDYADGIAYMNLLNSLQPAGAEPLFSQEYIQRTASGYDPDLYPNVDWLDAVTKDYAYSTRANLSVSGGSNFLRYSLVASVFHESGIMERDYTKEYETDIKLTRYNLRTNVDVDITSTTTLRMNLGGYMQNRRGPNWSIDDVFWKAFNHSPVMYPYRYSDGTVPDACVSGSRQNAWWALTQNGHVRTSESQIQALVSLEQDLKMVTPGLKVKGTFAFDTYNANSVTRAADAAVYHKATGRDEEGNLIHQVDHKGDGSLGHSTGANFGNKRTYFELAAMYNHRFGVHDIDAMFLFNRQWYDEGSTQPYRKQGVAGRMSYIFDGRYVAEFNFGYNGSENFAPGKRYGFFPSFALGWLLSSERFMAGVSPIFNKIKFRGSYGKVGNDNIGGRRFAYISTVNTGAAKSWFGVPGAQYEWGGITEGEVGVENLTWETAWKANIGMELGIANQIDFHVDFFRENRSNIFMRRSSIPSQAGFPQYPWANFGKVKNEGVEFSINYMKNFGKDWTVNFRGNFTYAKNTVIEADEPPGRIGTHRAQTGQSMNTLWGLTAERLFTADDFDADGNLLPGIPAQNVGSSKLRPGDIKYVDMNGDNEITEDDEGYIGGTYDPRIVYGFGATIRFKWIDFGFFFQGVGDTHRIIGGDKFLPGAQGEQSAMFLSNYEDRWTEENPSQDVFYPRLDNIQNKNNYRASTWWKKDMSFLRCKNIEIGYTFSESVLKTLHLSNLRLYVSGNDLFYFSKFKLWDPEINSDNGNKYPGMKSVMFGLNLGF